MAWAATYMLAEVPLPSWALGRKVVAVGAQTNRAVDDVAIVTDAGGWVAVQAKKGLRLEKAKGSPLAEALYQLIDLDAEGVPDAAPYPERRRALDPGRDRIFILTDETASATVGQNLTPVVDRLRQLPPAVPLTETYKNQDEERAFGLLRDHLGRRWTELHNTEMQEADLRGLGRLLGVTAVKLSDGGEHNATVLALIHRC